MNLLLDAHAFIWLDDGRQKLSPNAASTCADRSNTLWLSTVTLWEIQIKFQIGKLKLSRNHAVVEQKETKKTKEAICFRLALAPPFPVTRK